MFLYCFYLRIFWIVVVKNLRDLFVGVVMRFICLSDYFCNLWIYEYCFRKNKFLNSLVEGFLGFGLYFLVSLLSLLFFGDFKIYGYKVFEFCIGENMILSVMWC